MDDQMYDTIEAAILKDGVHKDMRVSYAMDEDLGERALTGKVKIILDEFYQSAVLTDPTYLDIVVVANDMIHVCGMVDHIYLESIDFEKNEGDVKLYSLHFGS